jgi:peptide/nickel transport system permease protein
VRGENLSYWLKDFWSEFRKNASGLVGLAFLGLFAAAALFEPLIVPFAGTNGKWRDITYWDDNPKSAPPAWTNWFAARKSAVSTVLRPAGTAEETSEGVRMVRFAFPYDFHWDRAPLDIIVHFTGSGSIPLSIAVQRPDGLEIELYREQAVLSEGEDVRVPLGRSAQNALFDFARAYETEADLGGVDIGQIRAVGAVFAVAEPGMLARPRPLKGRYSFTLTVLLLDEASRVEMPRIALPGGVSGILGTDSAKRDLWSGMVAGVKWALLIGLLTSLVAVALGVVYGIVSAYFGGWVDAVMQRIFEIFVNMPLLPILIVMSAVFRPSIWFMILMMSAFFWVGPVKTVRSIALQIKEETYIEASRALGAGSGRIIFRHMVPLLVPYSFASMALYVPGAVVYEATVSLLGLGDARIVTWGQLLRDALGGGAVLNGLWWWVIPPGIAIALMGMTFAFIGFAMDKILHPKLRTR